MALTFRLHNTGNLFRDTITVVNNLLGIITKTHLQELISQGHGVVKWT